MEIWKTEADFLDENDHKQLQALDRPEPVEGEDLSAPPLDGNQYLRRVIAEAKMCDAVTVANIKIQPQQRDIQVFELPEKTECSIEFLPNKDWQLATTADFSQLRLNVETRRKVILQDPSFSQLKKSLPKKEDDEAWRQIVQHQWPDLLSSAVGPSTKLCLAMGQVKIWHVLGHLNDWLEDGVVEIQNCCRWVYCLLACLELPMESDVYFTLRQIARSLIDYRAKLGNSKAEELPHINLIVCIIGRYFSQCDLADPFID